MQSQLNPTTLDVLDEASDVLVGREPYLRDAGDPDEGENPAVHLPVGLNVVVGRVVGLAGVEPLVEYAGAPSGLPHKARTIIPVPGWAIGREAVLAFEQGDPSRPIVLGLIQSAEGAKKGAVFEADGERFVVVAEREIQLRCGEASITLTRAGKVLIRGEYVLTRSKGVNCIKGASVSIN